MTGSAFGDYSAVNHYELALIRSDGTIDIRCYGYQPRTDDFAEIPANKDYTYVVQKIGNIYEVYDLKTLRPGSPMGWTIGLPVAAHTDMDAAIMQALLLT